MKHIFDGLPEYVRITILSQIRRLLSTSLFNYEDMTKDIREKLWQCYTFGGYYAGNG